eukprot:scaffold177_cov334-Pavlova_lutheri.AAC.38
MALIRVAVNSMLNLGPLPGVDERGVSIPVSDAGISTPLVLPRWGGGRFEQQLSSRGPPSSATQAPSRPFSDTRVVPPPRQLRLPPRTAPGSVSPSEGGKSPGGNPRTEPPGVNSFENTCSEQAMDACAMATRPLHTAMETHTGSDSAVQRTSDSQEKTHHLPPVEGCGSDGGRKRDGAQHGTSRTMADVGTMDLQEHRKTQAEIFQGRMDG